MISTTNNCVLQPRKLMLLHDAYSMSFFPAELRSAASLVDETNTSLFPATNMDEDSSKIQVFLLSGLRFSTTTVIRE